MIRIVLADDQSLLRAGLRSVLSAEDDLVVVGEASDGAEAARTAQALDADVVLMDIQMPSVDGIEGVRRIVARGARAKVLMLTMFDLDEYVYSALRAGASGFLLKSAQPEEIVRAVRDVHDGALLFAPTVTKRLVEAYVRTPPSAGGARIPDGAGARCRVGHRPRVVQCRDRGRAASRCGDGQGSRQQHPGEARAA